MFFATPTLDQFEKFSKILAVFIGGAWAVMNYLRGRTFKSRLELSLAAVARRTGKVVEVAAKLSAKNVGLAQVALEPIGSGLRVTILGSDVPVTLGGETSAELPETFTFLPDHDWVEPGEMVVDEIFFRIQDGSSVSALRLVATQLGRTLVLGEEVERAKSIEEAFQENTTWTATAVVLIPAADGAISSASDLKEKTNADTIPR